MFFNYLLCTIKGKSNGNKTTENVRSLLLHAYSGGYEKFINAKIRLCFPRVPDILLVKVTESYELRKRLEEGIVS